MYIYNYMRKSIKSELQIIYKDIVSKIRKVYPKFSINDFFGLSKGKSFYGYVDLEGDIFLSDTLSFESKALIYVVIIHEISHVITERLFNFKLIGRISCHGFLFKKTHKFIMDLFLKENEDDELNKEILNLIHSNKLRRYFPI